METKMSYIKLDRKMLEWEWFTEPSTAHLWVYILLKANHKRKTWQNMVIDEGCFVTSEARLCVETGLSRQQVRTALSKLISTNEITKISTKTYTLICVNKWADYQYCPDVANQEITNVATNRPYSTATTTKEVKEVKEDKKEIYKERFVRPSLDEIKAYCESRHNGVDAERFYDYYQSNGWVQGKSRKPIKDWRACVRTWERNTKVCPEDTIPVYDDSKNKQMSEEEKEELLRLMGRIG